MMQTAQKMPCLQPLDTAVLIIPDNLCRRVHVGVFLELSKSGPVVDPRVKDTQSLQSNGSSHWEHECAEQIKCCNNLRAGGKLMMKEDAKNLSSKCPKHGNFICHIGF